VVTEGNALFPYPEFFELDNNTSSFGHGVAEVFLELIDVGATGKGLNLLKTEGSFGMEFSLFKGSKLLLRSGLALCRFLLDIVLLNYDFS
jgi:hypothetical protein